MVSTAFIWLIGGNYPMKSDLLDSGPVQRRASGIEFCGHVLIVNEYRGPAADLLELVAHMFNVLHRDPQLENLGYPDGRHRVRYLDDGCPAHVSFPLLKVDQTARGSGDKAADCGNQARYLNKGHAGFSKISLIFWGECEGAHPASFVRLVCTSNDACNRDVRKAA